MKISFARSTRSPLGLMAVLLGVGALGSPKMLLGCPNTQISLILASIFNIFAIYSPIGLCFGYGAPVGLCYHISKAHGPISRFRGPWGPINRLSASNFDI